MAMDGNARRLTTISVTAMFLAVTFLAFAPGATAQTALCPTQTPVTSTLTIDVKSTSAGNVKPITGEGTFEADVELSYNQGGSSLSPIQFTYTASADKPYASVVLSKKSDAQPVEPASDGPKKITSGVSGIVYFDKNAPAFDKVKVIVNVESSAGTCIQKAEPRDGEASFTAGFYAKMQARFDKSIIKTGQNSQITLPLIVENFGNGEIVTQYSQLNAEKSSVSVVLPSSIIVPSAIGTTLDPKQTLNIDVNTDYKNGYMNEIEPLALQITSKSNDNQEIDGQTVTVNALIRTQGVYVPGFDAVAALGAIALAGLVGLVRRRQ